MSVVGQGRSAPRANGNAVLRTRDRSGDRVSMPLWISAFSTDLSLLVSRAQLRTRVAHRPIRFQERYVVAKVLFPSFANVYELNDRVRDHWAWNLASDEPALMILNYYGANKRYRGLIDKLSAGETRFEVIQEVEIRLRVVMDRVPGLTVLRGRTSPFAPTAGTASDFGRDWYRADRLADGNRRRRRADKRRWKQTRSAKKPA